MGVRIASSILCIFTSQAATYLAERVRLDLRKLVLHVTWIHCVDLISRRSPENLDNLNQLIYA